MAQGSTLFLRAAIAGMGLAVVGLCILILPAVYREWANEYPNVAYLRFPVLAWLLATTVPFFIASFQGLKLLNLIDKNQAFSAAAVRTLSVIKYCALTLGGLYALILPLVHYMTQEEDAPGLMIIGLTFTGGPIVVGVFMALLQRLFQNAVDIKSENDLTV